MDVFEDLQNSKTLINNTIYYYSYYETKGLKYIISQTYKDSDYTASLISTNGEFHLKPGKIVSFKTGINITDIGNKIIKFIQILN